VHDPAGRPVAEVAKRMLSDTHEVRIGGDVVAQVRHEGFLGDRYEVSSAYGPLQARGRLAAWTSPSPGTACRWPR